MNLIQEPRKILIIRLSSLGDIVQLTSILEPLHKRYPKAKVDFLTKEQYKPLLLYNPQIFQVITFDTAKGLSGWLSLCQQLQQKGYSLFIDFHSSIRSLILGRFLRGIPSLRYKKPYFKRILLFYFYINLFADSYNLRQAYFNVLHPLNIYANDNMPEIYLDEQAKKDALEIIRQHNITKPYVTFLPVATWYNKRYPLPKFVALAKKINEDLNIPIIWLGGSQDDYLTPIKDLLPDKSILLRGMTDLTTTLALLSESRAVIGNDTGLVYAAEALGVPVGLILGPTSRETGAGCNLKQSLTFERQIWCRPCSQKGDRVCYRQQQYCLDIAPTEIFSTIKQSLLGA